MKAFFVSLGCPKNLTDTEVLMGKLFAYGYQITTDEKEADIFVVNTCAFLKPAREEVFQTVKELKKYRKKIYLAGCLPRLQAGLPRLKYPLPSGISGTIESINIFDSTAPRIKATPPWTAYVKIAEGCDNNCSYCLIPRIRGKLRVRKVNDIINEVKLLAKRGVVEIIYIAQDIASHPHLPTLLQKTAKIKPIKWIRLMYVHPSHVTGRLLKVMSGTKKICRYIDLPIQHISDKILKGMNRPACGGGQDIDSLIAKIREAIPGIVIRTSLMVGFPGEKDSDFEALYNFVEKTRFDRLGVFKYSREAGTPAAEMRGQVPEKIKESRFQKIMALQKKISRTRNKNLIGKEYKVLCEGRRGSYFTGRTYMFAPEIDGQVRLKYPGNLRYGRFVHAKVISSSAYDLTAKVIT